MRRLPRLIVGAFLLGMLVLLLMRARPYAARDSGRVAGSTEGARAAFTSARASVETEPSCAGRLLASEWFIDRAATPIVLSGRAFRDGVAASGIDVVLTDGLPRRADPAQGERRDVPAQRTTTDAEGRFTFDRVPPYRGYYRVEAYSQGVAPSATWVPGDASKRDIDLLLESCRTHVVGVVRDASGGVVVGARVSIEMLPEHAVYTDARGEFRLCSGPRSGRLKVDSPGYGSWMMRIAPRGELRQDVTLSPEASVAGKVVFQDSGAPLPFARVTLRSLGDVFGEAVADEDGAFAIAHVSPGPYAVEAHGPSSATKMPVDVAVFAGATAHVTVSVERRASVAGRVVSNAGPVGDAAVSLGYNGTFEWSNGSRTGADGRFVLREVPVGERLTIRVDDYSVDTPSTLSVPEVGLQDVVLRVKERAELAVSVTRNGEPVRQANVSVRGPSSPSVQTTGADGHAIFRGLAAGAYKVVCDNEMSFAVRENVQVAPTGSTVLSLELETGNAVEGRIVDTRGAAVDGARVDFILTSTSEDGSVWAVTGKDGEFRGGPLRANASYRISVTRSRLDLGAIDAPRITVDAEGRVTPAKVVVVVEPHDRELEGVVLDGAGGPVPDARVIVTRTERHGAVLATTTTGNDGAFRFRELAAGPYAVKATAPSGSESERKPIALPAGAVIITMPVVGIIQGTLRGFRRMPSVMAWSVAGYQWDFHPATFDGNRYTITGVPEGRYHVAATTTEGAFTVTVEMGASGRVEVDLVASNKRAIVGRTLDFVTGEPLAGLTCQAAPYIPDNRSPVVIPGTVTSNENGTFAFDDVPASDLYMWCWSDRGVRGGAVRVPAADPSVTPPPAASVTVPGLDPRGKVLDAAALGMTFDDDRPFSRRIVRVEPKAPAERAGIRVGDVIERVNGRIVDDGGNGLARSYLSFVLASAKRTNVTVLREGAPITLEFALE